MALGFCKIDIIHAITFIKGGHANTDSFQQLNLKPEADGW